VTIGMLRMLRVREYSNLYGLLVLLPKSSELTKEFIKSLIY
jgi:hypothetical protein